jgi:hypothetical protein
MQHIRALAPPHVHAIAFAVLIAAAIASLTLWPRPSASPQLDVRCERLDQEAQAVLATLLSDRSAIAEAHLGDALFRLKRARKHCRFGFAGLARLDYDALLGNRYQFGQ